jgi:hypothetical protein
MQSLSRSSHSSYKVPQHKANPRLLIIITIIIGKTALFEPQPSLEDSSIELDHPVSTSLYFTATYITRSSALRPIPNLEDQVPVFMSPSDRVAKLYAQARDFLFVAFYDPKG